MTRTPLFDKAPPQEAIEFIGNILESSTESSVIANDLEGKILLWNEGARGIYGDEPEEIVEKACSTILRTPEDVHAGKPRKLLDAALLYGKWEGSVDRVRKNGERFAARVDASAMTASFEEEREAIAPGVDSLLQWPVDPETVLGIVDKWVGTERQK